MITTVVSKSGYGVEDRNPDKIQAAILNLEAACAALPEDEKIPIEPIHYFAPGLYVREIHLPAGSINTGKYHIHDDILIIAKGTCTFITEHSEKTYEGPCVAIVKAETKPAVWAHTDVVMISAHVNADDSRDIELIENRIVHQNQAGQHFQEVLK